MAGVFSPGELIGFAIIAAVVFGVHAVRVHGAVKHVDDPLHEEIAQAAHEHRERRGF